MLTRRTLLGATGASLVALRTAQAAMPPNRTAPDFDIPRGACDCHTHVFDPGKFPFIQGRAYTPPDATLDELTALMSSLHMDRVVIVQPSVYGTDNSCTLDGIRRLGKSARGVAVIDKSTSAAALDDMTAAGIRGVRLNQTSGQFDRKMIETTAEQIRGRGWHMQFYTRPSVIAELKDDLAKLPFPVVFDHFGGAKAALGTSQPGFDAMLELVKSGHAYVKISGAYRSSEKSPDFADVLPLAQAIIAANPDRVVWGTDWPHPGRGRSQTDIAPPHVVDDGLLLNQLPRWTSDPAIRKKILVDNPARLYGFEVTAL
jgi:predicted TIM-barrel fold metal-dependent hydrolase